MRLSREVKIQQGSPSSQGRGKSSSTVCKMKQSEMEASHVEGTSEKAMALRAIRKRDKHRSKARTSAAFFSNGLKQANLLGLTSGNVKLQHWWSVHLLALPRL